MKYIITEEQNNKIYFLRRFNNDWMWIEDIVKEGMDIHDPCDHTGSSGFIKEVIDSSILTYLFNYFDDWKSKEFQTSTKFLEPMLYKKFGKIIRDYYYDYKPNCEER